MPRLPVVLGLAKGPERRRRHGMRKTRVFGQLMGVQGMVVGDVTMQPDRDGDGEILVVSVRPDARSGGRCAQCRRSCPGYDAGVGTRRWRTVDTGTTRTFLESAAPRVQCPASPCTAHPIRPGSGSPGRWHRSPPGWSMSSSPGLSGVDGYDYADNWNRNPAPTS